MSDTPVKKLSDKDVADIGAWLSLPLNPGETNTEYSKRLRRALKFKSYDRRVYIDGAPVDLIGATIVINVEPALND